METKTGTATSSRKKLKESSKQNVNIQKKTELEKEREMTKFTRSWLVRPFGGGGFDDRITGQSTSTDTA